MDRARELLECCDIMHIHVAELQMVVDRLDDVLSGVIRPLHAICELFPPVQFRSHSSVASHGDVLSSHIVTNSSLTFALLFVARMSSTSLRLSSIPSIWGSSSLAER